VQYRADVDGLRAVAVTSVVAYHLGTPQVSGGFVGVDVFFVISGFLITSLIHGELGEGRFTVTDFYRRRLRRIVPALVTVLLVTCLVASGLLFAPELHELSRSAIWAGLFSSNLYFWQHAGYFDAPSTSQPLLHTWSLGVEEQFYLFFPLLLLLLHRFARRHLTLALSVVSVASFVLGVWQVREGHATAAFYLLPARAWELGLGALLAVARPRLPAPAGHAASLLGLMLIAWSCHHYTGSTHFPGTAALAPVVGATLVIAAGEAGAVNRVLAWRPIVFVGLVSYSWYLWHWPAIVIYRLYTFEDLTWTSRAALAGGTFVLAVLSWRFVEGPLRKLRLPDRRYVVGFAAATSAAVVLLGLGLQPFTRLVHPTDAAEASYLRVLDTVHTEGNKALSCFILNGAAASSYSHATCSTPEPGKHNVVIVGDSHAADLYWGLAERMPAVSVLQVTASGCKPLLPLKGEARCVAVLKTELSRLKGEHVDAMVLSARWRTADLRQLARTIAVYRTLVPRVVVVGVSPEWFGSVPALLARAHDRGDRGFLDQHLDHRVFPLDRAMREVVESSGATYVSLVQELCSPTSCRSLAPDGLPMAFDYGHFTTDGSVVATDTLAQALSRLLALPAR